MLMLTFYPYQRHTTEARMWRSLCHVVYLCMYVVVDPMCVYVCMLAGKNENQKKST